MASWQTALKSPAAPLWCLSTDGSGQRFVRALSNFPFPEDSQQGAQYSSTLTPRPTGCVLACRGWQRPLCCGCDRCLELGDSQGEAASCWSAVEQGNSKLCNLGFTNPWVNSHECCGTGEQSRFSLGTKLPSCLPVLWPHLWTQSYPARKPCTCVMASLLVLNPTLQTARNSFLRNPFSHPLQLISSHVVQHLCWQRSSSLNESLRPVPGKCTS